MYNALTIAGSDSSGGAGIQADIKTFSANGVYGMSIITAVTAQNTQGIIHVQYLESITIQKQIEAIFDDIPVNSIKIGMLSNTKTIDIIVNTLKKYTLPPIVLDPVILSKSGYYLLSKNAFESLVKKLIPITTIITPNIPEAEELLKTSISTIDEMKSACIELLKLGSKNVLIKGGHLSTSVSTDILYDGKNFYTFNQKRINAIHTHGTGCTLSSAIAANLSKGCDIFTSVKKAKQYVTNAIKNGFALGNGIGPLNHFFEGVTYE